MESIILLNIPNYYSSYYLLALKQKFKIKFKMDNRFRKFNNSPKLIFELDEIVFVIDNDDPSGVNKELYDVAKVYFVTNKLKGVDEYEQEKVRPLFPHYPVNITLLYLKTFGVKLFRYLGWKQVLRQLYIFTKRPVYKQRLKFPDIGQFVFFSSRIWKKEPEANNLRAAFIKFCKSDKRIKFQGGFIPRSDGHNFGFDDEISSTKYSPKTFSKLSSKSMLALNNPAVCGAVSWRLAEYLNYGLFILSFPFKVELPIELRQDKEVHFVTSPDEYKSVLDKILDKPQYHKSLSVSAKEYFDSFCTPQAQAIYIRNILKENV